MEKVVEGVAETKEATPMDLKIERAQKLSGKIAELIVKESGKMKAYDEIDKHAVKLLSVSGVLSGLIAQGLFVSEDFMNAILDQTIESLRHDAKMLIKNRDEIKDRKANNEIN